MQSNPLSLIGLDESCSKVYLSMLSLGNTTAQEISKKTSFKRSTVYNYLDELIKNGIVTRVPLEKKVFYRAVDINTVNQRVDEKYMQFKDTLPSLLALSSLERGIPKIEILEGEEGISAAYRDMLNAKSFRFWSDLGNASSLFTKHFHSAAESIRKREITTKEIITGTKESIRASKNYLQVAGPTYSARVASIPGILNDSVIYDDTVTLFRMTDYNMYVVRIKDETIASTMSVLFDMAWKDCKTIKEYLK
jgi:sugar-specific transcriptional regulator TrmB